jgi:hypothetical protein
MPCVPRHAFENEHGHESEKAKHDDQNTKDSVRC